MPLPSYITRDVTVPSPKAVLNQCKAALTAQSVRLVGHTLVIEAPDTHDTEELKALIRSARSAGMTLEMHVPEVAGEIASSLIKRGFAATSSEMENERLGHHIILRLTPPAGKRTIKG